MQEDKLYHDERVRLECLAQEIHNHAMKPPISPDQILSEAARYEKFVRGHPNA